MSKIPIQLIAAIIADLAQYSTGFREAASAGDHHIVNGIPTASMKPDGLRRIADTLQNRVDQLIACLDGEVEVE